MLKYATLILELNILILCKDLKATLSKCLPQHSFSCIKQWCWCGRCIQHHVTIPFSYHFTSPLLAETTVKPNELSLFNFLVPCHWPALFRSFKFMCVTKVIHFVTSWIPLTSSQLLRTRLRTPALFSGQGLSARAVAACGVWLIVASDRMSGLGCVPDDGVSSVVFSPHCKLCSHSSQLWPHVFMAELKLFITAYLLSG